MRDLNDDPWEMSGLAWWGMALFWFIFFQYLVP